MTGRVLVVGLKLDVSRERAEAVRELLIARVPELRDVVVIGGVTQLAVLEAPDVDESVFTPAESNEVVITVDGSFDPAVVGREVERVLDRYRRATGR